jgi:hypothetical protein
MSQIDERTVQATEQPAEATNSPEPVNLFEAPVSGIY